MTDANKKIFPPDDLYQLHSRPSLKVWEALTKSEAPSNFLLAAPMRAILETEQVLAIAMGSPQ